MEDQKHAATVFTDGTCAGSCSLVGALIVAYFVLFPLSISYVVTHVARGFVPAADLGAAYEEVAFTTSDGLQLRGWFSHRRTGLP